MLIIGKVGQSCVLSKTFAVLHLPYLKLDGAD
jgi:hypothetical protein